MMKKITSCVLAFALMTGCGGGGDSSSGSKSTEVNDNPAPAAAFLPYSYQPKLPKGVSPQSIRAEGLPSWASLNKETGAIEGTPGPEDVSADRPFTLTAATGSGTWTQKSALKVLPAEAYLEPSRLAFDATDYEGEKRAIRNDLTSGTLKGEVTFAQSHTVQPNNNYAPDTGDETRSVYKPELVALREALLLFTPDVTQTPATVEVTVYLNGEPVGQHMMSHPNALPKSTYQGLERIEYSTRAWSVRLPWDLVRNGISLEFTVDSGAPEAKTGTLAAADIEIGEASQIVFQSVRLGLLTNVEHANGHFSLRDPILSATDYFQTLPVSKMIMGSYADMELDRVIIASGKIYDSVSDVEGGVYSGDMRENVAKSQVSVGINQANFGVTSGNMRQQYAHVFKQITNHHAWGNYQNGRVGHGLSGGNGIGTLYDSWGNEASHEWGHAYGLGHYPGANLTEDGRWQRHHADSGWGFMGHRNRMRDNFYHNQQSEEIESPGSHFMGRIPYGRDSMSGGSVNTNLSSYTHYTAYTARIIQSDLEQFPVPDETYATGYKKWSTKTGQYETHEFDQSGQFLAPVKTGVPVATLLGGYDPEGTNAVIYPVFHGNYGNVFDLPEPERNISGDSCWVDVRNASGAHKRIALAAERHHASTINQFHINLEASFQPTQASLSCHRNGQDVQLASAEFDGQIPELPPVAIVGQEHGYQQLRDREIAQLDKELVAMASSEAPMATENMKLWLGSYSEAELDAGLSETAKDVLSQIRMNSQSAVVTTALINKLKSERASGAVIQDALTDQLVDRGLVSTASDIELEGEVVRNNNNLLSTVLEDGRYISVVTDAEGQPEPARLIMSQRGSLHPADQPWNCLVPRDGRLALEKCDPEASSQSWAYGENGTLKNISSGQCVDYAYYNQRVLMYGCHGNNNQKWAGIKAATSKVLAVLPATALETLYGK